MIKFYSFLEALRYRSKCPLCDKSMEINDRDLVSRVEYPIGHPYQKFGFHIGKGSDDIMYLNPTTEKVEVEYSRRSDAFATLGNNIYSGRLPVPHEYSGMFYHALTLNCNVCCRYHYTLQVHANLTEGCLAGTYLNSESVSVEESETVHEVKNVYSTDKTEYACFPKDGSSKRQSMPLIPLNLTDPKETISRIRKLLIFS